MEKPEAIKVFGFDPEMIGLRHRAWGIVEEIEWEEKHGNAKRGYLAIRARDGGGNPIDAAACKKQNFVGTSEDGFDETYRYYYYCPIGQEEPT